MKNLFKNIVAKKKELISKISTEKIDQTQDNFNFQEFLITKGNIIYLPENFNFEHFTSEIGKYMASDLKQKVKTEQLKNNILKIEYSPAKGIMKSIGLGGHFVILLFQFEKQLMFRIKTSDWFENPQKKEAIVSVSAWIKDACETEITKFIATQIKDEFFEVEAKIKIDYPSRYIERLSLAAQTWFYAEQEKNEILLAGLEISEIKKTKAEKLPDSKLSFYYILTTENAMVAGFDQRGELDYFEELGTTATTVKKEIGRDPVTAGEIEWLTTRSNDTLFQEISEASPLPRKEKLRFFARKNFIGKSKESTIKLLEILIKETKNPFDEFSLFYASFVGKEMRFEENIDAEKLMGIVKKLIDSTETATRLTEWTNNWEISRVNKAALMKILTEAAITKEQEQRILPFHREVFTNFIKKEKDKINIVLAEITFAKNLINAGETQEAIELLEKAVTKLPDETVAELLPTEESDLTSENGGQILRVTLYDLLAQAANQEDSKKYKHKIAMLQPLSKKRLQALVDCKLEQKSAKAEQLITMLLPNGLPKATGTNNAERKVIPEKMFETFLRHPATRKNGTFHSIQKWLSKIEVPDHSAVKAFSDELKFNDYPQAYDAVKEIKKMFGRYDTQFFVARGDKSTGIIGFEGSPEFILIGNKHLDKNSDYYLTTPELKFAVSCEMAHLYYKHSKITSSDVWRGAMEKSFVFADSLLSFIPVVGVLGKTVQSLGKLANVGAVLQKAQKFSAAKEIVDAASKMSAIYSSITKKNKTEINENKKQEMLAVSRVMQLTADRAGLLFSGDISSAIRTIFMNSENYLRYQNEAKEHGLESFIMQKNNDGSFKHQHLAVRFANLYSFYLSWDYAELVKVMTPKDTTKQTKTK